MLTTRLSREATRVTSRTCFEGVTWVAIGRCVEGKVITKQQLNATQGPQDREWQRLEGEGRESAKAGVGEESVKYLVDVNLLARRAKSRCT